MITREKAVILALKVVDTCKTFGNLDRCLDCPFNFNGCIATDGNNVPSDWRVGDILTDKLRTKGEHT